MLIIQGGLNSIRNQAKANLQSKKNLNEIKLTFFTSHTLNIPLPRVYVCIHDY